jgi:hypothetical protein
VRALWAGQPFIWHIYPQDDNAHHAKLEAFLDWMKAPESLRLMHRVWSGVEVGTLPFLSVETLKTWRDQIQINIARLLGQTDLANQLVDFARSKIDKNS